MAKKSMKSVPMSSLAAKLEEVLAAPSAPTAATVTVTMAPEAPVPTSVKRKLTAEEQAYHEERWQAVHKILVAAIAELVKEGEAALKEEQRLADLEAFHEASYAPVQDYWTAKLSEVAEEAAKREADRLADLAAREAAVRARKLRQNANRDERAQANRDRANGGTTNKGNGNGKKGGKGK